MAHHHMVKEKPAFPVNRVSDFPHNISLECETATESLTLWQLIIDKPWMGPCSRSMGRIRYSSYPLWKVQRRLFTSILNLSDSRVLSGTELLVYRDGGVNIPPAS